MPTPIYTTKGILSILRNSRHVFTTNKNTKLNTVWNPSEGIDLGFL
jgi:hypothetical protein